jgi:hypothetical protein
VGPSGQWHCRPAPCSGWLPWVALSGRALRGYVDAGPRSDSAVSRVRAAPPHLPSEPRHRDPVSEADRRLTTHATPIAWPDASPASPPFRLPCPSAASLPRSEAARRRCPGKPLCRRAFMPSRPPLTALILLHRSPQCRESPPSRAVPPSAASPTV